MEREAEEVPAPFNPDNAFFTYVTKAYNVFLEGEDDYSEMAEELDAAYGKKQLQSFCNKFCSNFYNSRSNTLRK